MAGLSYALESGTGTSQAVLEIQLEHAQRELKEAELIAARRSGARGAKARQELIAKEEALKQAEEKYGRKLPPEALLTVLDS
jgi:hypothetical protein